MDNSEIRNKIYRGGAPVGYLSELNQLEQNAILFLRYWSQSAKVDHDLQSKFWANITYDLGITNNNNLLKDLKEHKFEIVYLVGQDNLDFQKKDEFIIYQGSHGDKGAEIADIILSGSAYTEQDGYFTNLEGKLQKAFKASYPPGEAKEDWLIINELSEIMNNKKLFSDKDELESSMFNYLNLQKKNRFTNPNNKILNNKINEKFRDEFLKIQIKDYFFSNVIARSSKTMIECNNSRLNLKSTGTEG